MSESGSLTRQQLQHQAEFVIKGLKRLAEYDYHLGITDTPADLSIDRLHCSRRLIRAFSLPQEDQRSRAGNSFPAALRSIDGAMRWSSASELDIVCKGLEKHVAEIDRLLDVLIVMANPENDEDMRTPLVIRLAQSISSKNLKISQLFSGSVESAFRTPCEKLKWSPQ
ncbi:hypothetical protein PtA15_5A882 [Puccinia triticina]|uniref:Uncharacterized protein n=1 Tax=Puccinia triticina TaxID=208348 RepID=A0ABY7CMV2_9BASI|nr:uncharacterized protein PtA15_5A882 [Puccinia triticina]WAQ85307.1 hypothetical protein PtA15_5A882 [Puccinia triticina]